MTAPREQGLTDLVNFCAAGLVVLMIRGGLVSEGAIRDALTLIAQGIQDGTLGGAGGLDDSERATYRLAVAEAEQRIQAALDQLLILFPDPTP